ncbi:tetratricopeptide repeat protein [Meridianimarinicoccus roseus]|nr:tetratricopeptide repeat protein [Meridianimarinicoccus roseus]
MPVSLPAAAACVNLCVGLSALANATGLSLIEVQRFLGCIQDAKTLARAVSTLGLGELPNQLARQAQQRAADLEAAPEFSGHAKDCVIYFEQVIGHCDFSSQSFVGLRTDATAIVEAMREHIAQTAPKGIRAYFADPNTLPARFFVDLTQSVIDALLKNPKFQPLLEYDRWRVAFALLDAIKDDTGAIREDTGQILSLMGELAQKIDKVDNTTTARAEGVSDRALFRLVRPIAEHVEDRDEALLALKEAVDIAARVQAEGRHGSNLGGLIDDVLSRVTALSAEGAYTAAISELDEALQREEAESQARTLRLLNAAIDQHLLAFDADGAATKLARRVTLETTDPAARFGVLRGEQDVWYERGRDKGLRLDLDVSIALARITRHAAQGADQRGAALNDLGLALQTLGEREAGTDRLEQAVTAYHAALEEFPRDSVPLDWAMTQMNLGNALQTLGKREAGTDRLEQAVTAYRAALEEWTRDRVPLDWAMTQNNLGNALLNLGKRAAGTDRLEAAVTAYRAALEVRTRDSNPLDWATKQMNLGNALTTLGEREAGTDRLEEAVAAYRAALEERTRDRVPLQWAMTQMNLGNALTTLGRREAGTDRLEEAVTAYRAALEECTRDRVPLDWAMTQMNLGTALKALGEREAGTDRLEEAVAAYRAALEERTRDRVPLDWAMTQMNLGNALRALGEREAGIDRLEEAVSAHREALEEYTRERVPLDWAMTQGNLCNVHFAFFDKTGDPARLDAAQTALDGAREVFAQAGASQYLAVADRQQAAIDARRG